MSIAQRIADILNQSSTFTLYGGYAQQAGRQVQFPQGHCELEKRNDKGQVSRARYHYADGSRLTYIRKPDNAFRIEVSQ
jgi:hypothetical protein